MNEAKKYKFIAAFPQQPVINSSGERKQSVSVLENFGAITGEVVGGCRVAVGPAGVRGRGGGRGGSEGGTATRRAAVNWNFGNFCRIVFTLNFVMWVKVKPEFTSVCAAVLLNCKVDSQVCRIDFHLMFIRCFKVAAERIQISFKRSA